jgi:thymidine kinase
MLIFGWRVRNKLLTTLHYVCDQCARPAAHELFKQQRTFTLFFAPLFPIAAARYIDACRNCGRTLEVPRDSARAALAQQAAVARQTA